jgi:hypothetical protein
LFKIAQRLSFSRKTRMPAYQANPDQAPGGLHSLETGWGLWKGWTNHPLLDIVYTMYYNKNQTICMCFLDALITVTVRPRLLDTVTIRLTKVYCTFCDNFYPKSGQTVQPPQNHSFRPLKSGSKYSLWQYGPQTFRSILCSNWQERDSADHDTQMVLLKNGTAPTESTSSTHGSAGRKPNLI